MAKVAFIGLGVMGYPMAGHLAKRGGHDVVVYNRTGEKARKWAAQHGGRVAATPREAAEGASFVFSCVGNDDDLRSVTLGDDGAVSGLGAGAVYVDHTTTSAVVARELFGLCEARQVAFLDAPVSGGQAGAENGALAIMVGGDAGVFERAKPVMDAYAKSAQYMGAVGSGQLTKMVNQICLASVVQGLSEGIHFAKRAGLDVERVIGAISHGAAQSWQMDNRWKTMRDGEFEHGFAVDWMRKDLGMCLAEARQNGAQLPVTALLDGFYGEVQRMGGGRWDTSSLLALLERPEPD